MVNGKTFKFLPFVLSLHINLKKSLDEKAFYRNIRLPDERDRQ